jgi:hypothetical protein
MALSTMRVVCRLAVLAALFTCANPGGAQGTALTYQGKLGAGGAAASGFYDLRFTVYDSTNVPGNVVAGPLTNFSTAVGNGLLLGGFHIARL